MDTAVRVDPLRGGLRADLERLAALPSVTFPGLTPEPVRDAHDPLVEPLQGAGVGLIERTKCASVEKHPAGFRPGAAG